MKHGGCADVYKGSMLDGTCVALKVIRLHYNDADRILRVSLQPSKLFICTEKDILARIGALFGSLSVAPAQASKRNASIRLV